MRLQVGDGENTLFWRDKRLGNIPLKDEFPDLFGLANDTEATVKQRCFEGTATPTHFLKSRCLFNLFAWCIHFYVSYLLLLHFVSSLSSKVLEILHEAYFTFIVLIL